MPSDIELKSQEATYLLSHPLLKGAFETVKQDLVNAIEDAPLGDFRLQRELMLSLQVLRTVRGRLERHIETFRATQITVEEY